MDELWPWSLVVTAGALHGLHPATGWMLAAGWGLRTRDASWAWRALVPIAAGHAASVLLVAGAVGAGVRFDRHLLPLVAGGLLASLLLAHCTRGKAGVRWPAGQMALALWSFGMASMHGAGLALVPVLLPLCGGASTAGDSEPLVVALVAALVHLVAMLAVTGVLAVAACRGAAAWPLLRGAAEAAARAVSRRRQHGSSAAGRRSA